MEAPWGLIQYRFDGLQYVSGMDTAATAMDDWTREPDDWAFPGRALAFMVAVDFAGDEMVPKTLKVRVSEKYRVAENAFGFRLTGQEEPLPPADPGAHIDVHLPSGLVRQYSLTTSGGAPEAYEIGVLREASGRGGSKELCDELAIGDDLVISAPRNNFALHPNHGRTVLLAGGIGITPLLSMARALQERGAEFDLHHCARSPEHAAFRERVAQELSAANVHYHYDEIAEANPLDIDGFIAGLGEGDHLYACGPAGFLEAVEQATSGWERGRFHCERFVANVAPLTAEESGAFNVRLAGSGREFVVPGDKSILEILQEAGLPLDFSCQEGVCGTCIAMVLESGAILHRDSCLYPDERDANSAIALCVSRGAPGTTIVLDL